MRRTNRLFVGIRIVMAMALIAALAYPYAWSGRASASPVPYAAFHDDFEDGDSNGWTIVGADPPSKPGIWSVEALDGSNVFTQTSAEALAEGLLQAGDAGWGDYTVEARVMAHAKSGSGDASGILFRLTDNQNYYLFRLNWSTKAAQLLKKAGGVYSTKATFNLGEASVRYGEWYDLKVVASGNRIEGYVDGAKVMTYQDQSSPHLHGKVGFRTYAQTFSFDDYTVFLNELYLGHTPNIAIGNMAVNPSTGSSSAVISVHAGDLGFLEGQEIRFSGYAEGSPVAVTPALAVLDSVYSRYEQGEYYFDIPVTLATEHLTGSAIVAAQAVFRDQTAAAIYPLTFPPQPAAGLRVTLTADKYVFLDWDETEGATQYRLFASAQASGPYEPVYTGVLTNRAVSGLQPGTTYYFKASALNGSGESVPSPAVSVTTRSGPYEPAGHPGYTLAFEDTFDGNALDTTVWNYRIDAKGDSSQRAENVRVENGNAVVEVRKESYDGKAYTGGGIASKEGFGYGYYEARIRNAVYDGWHPSFWTSVWDGAEPKPDFSSVPRIEIDINEFELGDAHWGALYRNNVARWYPDMKWTVNEIPLIPDLQQDYHIWAAEYTPDTVRFYMDGELTSTIDITGYPTNPQHIWLSVIGYNPIDDSKLPGAVYVDYIRYYEPDGEG